MKQLFIIMVVGGLLAAPSNAQDREARPLSIEGLGFMMAGAQDVLAFDTTVFLRGWNWVEMDSLSSAALGVNLWHWRDPWLWQGADDAGTTRGTESYFIKEHQPGQLLIIAPDGITLDAEHVHFYSPVEAMSMEYQPWLEGGSDGFVLRGDDSTGGIFGFHDRSPRGSVVRDSVDSAYRYRLTTDAFESPLQVLANVEHSEALYRNDGPYDGFITDTVWFAINLRRNDASADSGREDEPVLRIRVPYWLYDPCSTDSTFARFRFLPAGSGVPISETSDLGDPMGLRWPTMTDTTASTEFVITRRMVPQLSDDERDITIHAGLLFDHDEAGTPLLPWQNPHLNNHPWPRVPYQVEKVGVNIHFMDELGVDIKWVRLETAEARRLFWGKKDRQIMESMHDLVANLIAFKNDYYPNSNDQPRLYRLYGRDEIRLAHFKGFRYVNRLLHRFMTTEWEVQEYEKARHCLQLKEMWQGNSFRPHDQTYSPAFLHGYLGSIDQDSVNLYCGYRTGRADIPDFETDLFGFDTDGCRTSDAMYWSPAPLPIPDSLLDVYITAYSGGVQSRIEYHLRTQLLPNVAMLFDSTVPYLQNVWIYSSGVIGVYPMVRFKLVQNGRPKSPEEIRLQHWQPLVLGAKGLVEYAGRTTGAVPPTTDWASVSGPGALPWTTSVTRDVGTQYTNPTAISAIAATGDARIDDDALGPDYLQHDEPDHLDLYITKGVDETASAMNMRLPNPPGIYLGRKSARQVIREVYRSLDPYWQTLMTLKLKGWRAKGYDHWFVGDTALYDRWLHREDAAHAAWVLHQPERAGSNEPRLEDYDSTFFDLTLHTTTDTSHSRLIYLGVLNRRTSGITSGGKYGTFHTYDSFFSLINHPDTGSASRLFSQHGSRRIRIPFNVSGGSGTVRLHVQELRAPFNRAIDQRPPLDVIINGHQPLDVDLLPGEGKFLRIEVIE